MVLYWLVSYVIGTFLTAWWIGKWKKTDLTKMRSGNLGARNAGAVLGKTAFLLTFLGDALKGVLILYLGFHFDFSIEVIAIGGLLGIVGHMFPFWLRFKGGKGIATFIGVALVLNPTLSGIMVVLFIISIALLRSATLSMLIAFSIYAILCWIVPALMYSWPLSIAILLILYRHRWDALKSWEARWWITK